MTKMGLETEIKGSISCGNAQLISIYIVFDELESAKYGIDIEKGDF